MSVSSSARLPVWNTSAPTALFFFTCGTYLCIVRKYIEKIQVSFQTDKNSCYFTWRPIHITHSCSYHSQFSFEWKKLQTKFTEDQNTHFMFNAFVFENRAVCVKCGKIL